MRGKFWRLYLKELKESDNFAILFGIIGIGWFIFLSTQYLSWGDDTTSGLSFITLTLLPLYSLIKGFQSFRTEWKSDTIYSLLSLPVPRWHLLFSKFLAAMTVVTGMSAIFILGIYFNSKFVTLDLLNSLPRSFGIGIYLKWIISLYILLWIFCAICFIISQFSFLISKLFNKFSGLITGVTFLFALWMVIRVGSIVGKLFFWLPDLVIEMVRYRYQLFYMDVAYFNISPIMGVIIASIGLFFIGAWLLENILEV